MHRPSSPAVSRNPIDALREETFVRAECFLEAYDAGRRADLARLAARLARAARAQFEAEEAMLAATRSLSLVRHQLVHAQFLADLEVIAAHARDGRAAELDALRVEDWLTAWLAAHGRTEVAPPRFAAVA